MKRITEPGDVNITLFEISNDALKARFNPLDQLVGFDIWEDMSKPTMYATFVFDDAINMLEKFPIIGEETVTVEIQTPGMSTSTRFVFRCFEVANVVKDFNGKSVQYTLRCVSEEHLNNASNLITQSYTNIISNIIPNILTTYLKTKKDFIFDETKGIQTVAIPRLNPLQTIDMFRQRAVSKEFTGSSYVFFENQSGFNFKTIEGLIKEGKKSIGSREFNANQNTVGTKQAVAESFRTLLDYQTVARSDTNKKAQEGAFKAVTKTFDIFTKKFESQDFDIKDVFGGFEKPGDKKQLPNTDSFIEKFGSGEPKRFFVPKDTTRPDNFIDTMVAVRNSFSVLLNSDITRAKIHGDSGLKVGDIVRLNMPQVSGTTDRKKEDVLSSGNYLIIRLRHMVTPGTKAKHQIVFDCVKMGI